MASFKNKRLIIESIPMNTPYCYLDSICKHYKHKKGLVGWCKLYKCEIIDQVKECGLNLGYRFYE